MSRLLKNYKNKVSKKYISGVHNGIDIIGEIGAKNNTGAVDYIVAHSDGQVVEVRKDYKTTNTTGRSYGNYVKIKHGNGYYTLYAHLKYNSIPLKQNDKVTKGQVIGFMGNTGYSKGAHLHFEVRDTKDNKIDPTNFIDSDLPNCEKTLKSIDEIALEVINNQWDVYPARKELLENAGYNYDEVQKRVNEILNANEKKTITYTVKQGDVLWKIAQKYNTTIDKIVKDNNIKNPDLILVGQKLIIK